MNDYAISWKMIIKKYIFLFIVIKSVADPDHFRLSNPDPALSKTNQTKSLKNVKLQNLDIFLTVNKLYMSI